MSSVFASYVTGSAFRIDLSRRMVAALLSSANGNRIGTDVYGVSGLVSRGLMEPIEGQEKKLYKTVRITDAGEKVAELCRLAGLDQVETR